MTKHFDVVALRALLKRVEAATGADPELDAEIAKGLSLYLYVTFYPFPLNGEAYWEGAEVRHSREVEPFEDYTPIPKYTASIDAAIALIERVLPGWWWSIGTCCLSDDARIAPDYNSPIHGDRLKREFPLPEPRQEWIDELGSTYGPFDGGLDTDWRPPGNVPLALLESLLRALIHIEETRLNDHGSCERKPRPSGRG